MYSTLHVTYFEKFMDSVFIHFLKMKPNWNNLQTIVIKYRTRAIITRGLYIFYPLFEGQKRFFKGLFS